MGLGGKVELMVDCCGVSSQSKGKGGGGGEGGDGRGGRKTTGEEHRMLINGDAKMLILNIKRRSLILRDSLVPQCDQWNAEH